jgi:hypothetical protein
LSAGGFGAHFFTKGAHAKQVFITSLMNNQAGERVADVSRNDCQSDQEYAL